MPVSRYASSVGVLRKRYTYLDSVTQTRLLRAEQRLVSGQKQIVLLRRKVFRFPKRLAVATDRASEKAFAVARAATVFCLKEDGVITDITRHMIRELVRLNVPVSSVAEVILVVAEAMGMQVDGSVHRRSVSRIVLEGLVAAKIQIAKEAGEADGITLSGDGTTHKNINYESCNMYLNLDDTHTRRFVGIHSAPNHTSEKQLEGWLAQIEDLCATYSASPYGRDTPLDARELICKITGMTTDHANDQKKLHRLVSAWKERCDREIRGEKAMMLMVEDDLGALLEDTTAQAIREVGGPKKWDAMDDAEKTAWDEAILQRVVRRLGDEQYASLPPEEKRSASLFVSGYCCMHKELNAVKGGNERMVAAWKKLDLAPPILLMNRDNAAAADAGTSDAQARAVEVSEGGGVKLTNLAGALFRHKDDKKGQQDAIRIFFEASSAVGAPVRFPDTSNTRYQSHCEAAAELLVHLDLYIEFLDFARDKKLKRTFNHMESNVYQALHDAPTLTELCVLALYSQSVSHPYLRQVRGHQAESDNHLDLAPLHGRLKAHIQGIIDDPSLLLAPDASYERGTLDGRPWERPDAFYAVHRLAARLPHLEPLLVEFFSGALDTWRDFTTEFVSGGLIDTLTSSERRRAWMRTTNDDNEGALGSYRISARRAPSLTLHQYNARTMYKLNETGDFIKAYLSAEGHLYLRAEARKMDGSGLERKRKREQAEYDERVVGEKRRKDQQKVETQAAKQELLNGLTPVLDPSEVQDLIVSSLKLQLDWYRQFDATIPSNHRLYKTGNKAALAGALEAAIARYTAESNASRRGESSTHGNTTLVTSPDDGAILSVEPAEGVESIDEGERDSLAMSG
ncbi:hypothetical protein OH77DRAFT_1460105 [Trametes cingulata]|nr:hypothetical protein OH77DRAFT_1460105 [Trametes cingulata]